MRGPFRLFYREKGPPAWFSHRAEKGHFLGLLFPKK